MSSSKKSMIFYNGFYEKSFCGYCKQNNTSCSNGMWASSLTVQAYQEMIDRGWRRSGKYCYKPAMDKTCCPLYTIRCEALNFQLSKSQKKIIKKVTKFLINGESDKNFIDIEEVEREPIEKYEPQDVHDPDSKMEVTNQLFLEEPNLSVNDTLISSAIVINKVDKNVDESVNLNCNLTTKESKKVKPGKGVDPNLPKCKKKKMLRIEKKLFKNPNYVANKVSVPKQKDLEDHIAENDSIFNDNIQKLRIKLIKLTPSSNSFEAEFSVYKLYQTTVHGDTEDRCSREQFIRFLVNSPLKTGTEAFAQTFTAEACLFAKYQIAVHNDSPDECDKKEYLNFLVESPLQAEEADDPNHPGYGSFHQQYWLGDKLIAVGVIDILPKCVSSVYLFYDPDFRHLVLGTYSSLREIHLVRQLNIMSPDLQYYYMGFYIHSCSKMRYKAQFRPSYLLCPLQYTWHTIDKCTQKLDNEKYSTFNELKDAPIDNDTLRREEIPILYSGTIMPYSTYKYMNNTENQDELITEYITLVGPKLARNLIYCILD